jgi:hypothetical protein
VNDVPRLPEQFGKFYSDSNTVMIASDSDIQGHKIQ